MQLNTFFCYRGVDSNLRFALINLSGISLVTLCDLLLDSHGLLIFIALFLLIVVGLSAIRRLQGQKTPLILLPAVSLLLMSVGMVYQWLVLSVIFAFLFVVSTITIGIRPLSQSIYKGDNFGYSGPLAKKSQGRKRVEPVLVPDEQVYHFDAAEFEQQTYSSESTAYILEAEQHTSFSPRERHIADDVNMNGSLSKLLWDLLHFVKRGMSVIPNAPAVLGGSIVVAVMLLVWALWPAKEQNVEVVDVQSKLETQRVEQVEQYVMAEMPDGFSVLLDGDALLLKWLGERGQPRLLWSLITAKGDSSCQTVAFNNGSEYRALEVKLLPDTSTVARFSPLDTQAIIKDIAMRGSLSLCGYQFSLKGSQAALAKEAAFRPYL